jgi:DNA polymerase elongation subunit (family B)
MKFCGHNIKEFDLPFLCRRMIINGLSLAPALQLNNKKPWEITHIDTLELWKFGDYKNYTSLALLAEVLGIPSPKSDIDGSMVGKVYWEEKNTERIAQYCMQDVLTTAKVFLKLSGLQEMDMQVAYL